MQSTPATPATPVADDAGGRADAGACGAPTAPAVPAPVVAAAPGVADVWRWLETVEDPEIPVLSIVDLGIVREVRFEAGDVGATGDVGGDGHGGAPIAPTCVVALTPTYSGCPATEAIAAAVRQTLAAHGVARLRLETRLAPPWTTDWMSAEGRRRLHGYGIAPPLGRAGDVLARVAPSSIGRGARPPAPSLPPGLACPRCGSGAVALVSRAGSTPCKSLYRCGACREPFDHFRCH